MNPAERPPESRWTDSRLDDFVRRMNGLPERVVVLEEHVRSLDIDLSELKASIDALVKRLEHGDKDRAVQEKADREHREEQARIDRRWRVGTALSMVTIMLMAAGILVSVVG